jgi:hypothetical protein
MDEDDQKSWDCWSARRRIMVSCLVQGSAARRVSRTIWGHVVCLVIGCAAVAAADDLPLIEVAPECTTALREQGTGKPFVAVGVNYFGPHEGWAPKLWHRFDPALARQHLQLVREQGFNTIRVFLTLDSFHQQPGQVRAEGVEKFRQLLAICRDLGIRVVPSGPDHWEGIPAWLKENDPPHQVKDQFADEEVLRANEAWWEAFTALFRDDPTILAWDLLNEPSVRWESPAMKVRWNQWLEQKYGTVDKMAAAHGLSPEQVPALGQIDAPRPEPAWGDPRLYDYQLFRESIADAWTRRLVAAVRRGDPHHLVTIGQIQWASTAYLPSVQQYAAFNLSENAKLVDFVTMHFYPIAPPRPCDSPEGVERNGEYLEAVLRECSVGKPVMIGEFAWYGGGELQVDGRTVMPAQSLEDQVTWNQKLLEVSRGRVCGWLHWAFADTPTSRDLTRWSGLWTEDLQLKPWGRIYGQFAREATQHPAAPRPFAALAEAAQERRNALTDPLKRLPVRDGK